jgi:hypothetical protein
MRWICCALVLAGCGAAAGYHNPKYPYGAPNVPISLSKCMRANGVSSFPDPQDGGFPGGLVLESDGEMVVMGQPLSGPAVARAQKACGEYLPHGTPPALSESQRQAALAHAACMRSHGLPNFPDPNFNGPGKQLALGPGLDPNSPAFQHAAKACGLRTL